MNNEPGACQACGEVSMRVKRRLTGPELCPECASLLTRKEMNAAADEEATLP